VVNFGCGLARGFTVTSRTSLAMLFFFMTECIGMSDGRENVDNRRFVPKNKNSVSLLLPEEPSVKISG
jgi:hypothetical protein